MLLDNRFGDRHSSDDAIHSNGNIAIKGGDLGITSGDDGIHADASVTISGGVIDIAKSYEGIKGAVVTISDGEAHVVASDDGVLNESGVTTGNSANTGPGRGGNRPEGGGRMMPNVTP
jgi:hypothetical protein